MVVLTIALVPKLELGGGANAVNARATSSSMESVFIDITNEDNAPRTFRVFAIGAQSDTPITDVRLLPADSYDVAGGERKRALAVFERLRPGETREARVCYAPVNRPADRTCAAFAIERL